VPFDTSFRATSLPQTAMNALFPALAETQARPDDSARLLALAMRAVVVLVLPAVLVVAVFAHPLLALWLNVHFAGPAAPVLQLLLIGIFLNSAAHLPYALLQAHGRSDLTAKLHLLELPVFAALLVAGVHWFGITGAALAWTLRVALDTALLYFTAWWLHRPQRAVLARGAGLLCLATTILLFAIYVLHGIVQIALVCLVVIYSAATFLRVLLVVFRKSGTG
jgi:O-antigen/teichoic acid export membrane protein